MYAVGSLYRQLLHCRCWLCVRERYACVVRRTLHAYSCDVAYMHEALMYSALSIFLHKQ